jgi:hypothetical protein
MLGPMPPDPDRTADSADMVTEPPAADPADLAGVAATGTAEQMHDEVDGIAESADAVAPGHGPDTP